ncbi:hypothetical protein PAMP_012516 [Pampus punctatissimus]
MELSHCKKKPRMLAAAPGQNENKYVVEVTGLRWVYWNADRAKRAPTVCGPTMDHQRILHRDKYGLW